LFVFIKHFGTLLDLVTAGWEVREAMYGGQIELPLAIRTLSLVGYAAVPFALVYWIRYGYKNFLLLPFLSVILFGLTQVGRAGMLMVTLQVFFASFWRDKHKGRQYVDMRFGKRIVVILLVIICIFFLGQLLREQTFVIDQEIIQAQLLNFKYYAFGGMSAFGYYLDNRIGDEDLTGGRYTFSSIYQLLGIHAQEMGIYNQYLPATYDGFVNVNIYTAFRPMIEDFGLFGAVMFMFSLGLISSIGFRLALRGSLSAIAFVIIIYTYLAFTVLAPLTQFSSYLVSIIIVPFTLAIMAPKRLSYPVIQQP
jgi:oligosaccharide repeat unit polymerase